MKEVINYCGKLMTFDELETLVNSLACDASKLAWYRDDRIFFNGRTPFQLEMMRKAEKVAVEAEAARLMLKGKDKALEDFEREFAESHNVPLNTEGMVEFYEYSAVGMDFDDMLTAWNAKETAAAEKFRATIAKAA